MRRSVLHCGDALDVLRGMPEASFDACLTDPPYALTANKKGGTGEASLNLNSPAGRSRISTGGGFMGQKWDAAIPGPEVWAEVLRVLKPGAFLFAFGGTRTYHRLTCAIEDAGFEIRDSILAGAWVTGSGFPKSLSLQKATGDDGWEGYGTCLKPAHEPVVVAMKPLDGTFARNAVEHGVAGLNVDGGRIGTTREVPGSLSRNKTPNGVYGSYGGGAEGELNPNLGRYPSNLLLTHRPSCQRAGEAWECSPDCPVAAMDAQAGHSSSGDKAPVNGARRDGDPDWRFAPGSTAYGDSGPASRFFFQAGFEPGEVPAFGLRYVAKASTAERGGSKHPTLKPLELVAYLAKLLLPPSREDAPRRLLVPFSGAGSEVIGALRVGWEEVVGIEQEPEWIADAERRIRDDAPLWNEVTVVERESVPSPSDSAEATR